MPLFESERLSQEFADKLGLMISQHESGGFYDKHVHLWLSQIAPSLLRRLAKWGLVEQNRIEAAKPIDEHVESYIDHLRHKGNTEPYCRLCKTRINNVISGCRFDRPGDINAGKVMRYISDELTAGSISQSSFNHYIRQFKGFVRWLYREDKIQSDVNKNLHLRTITETVKDRRALSIDEIAYLLQWLTDKAKDRRSLSGFERMVLYKLALTTGLRADEIRHLTPASIDFVNKAVRLASAYTKNRREVVLPLRKDILGDLKKLVSNKLSNAPLFKLTDKTASMIRADLSDARKQYVADGGDDDTFLAVRTDAGEIDFHSLRHSYATLLVNGGTDVKTAQSLLRHTTPTLTLGVYSHVLRESEQAAVDNLPSFNVQAKKGKKKA